MKQEQKTIRLLVIEDLDDQWHLTKIAFQNQLPEALLVRASGSEQAIDYLTQYTYQEWDFPNMVLLDLYVPEAEDGWAVLQAIRNLPAPLCYTPVIMFSRSIQKSDIQKAYLSGVNVYLVKPTSPKDWQTCIENIREYWLETAALLPKNFVI